MLHTTLVVLFVLWCLGKLRPDVVVVQPQYSSEPTPQPTGAVRKHWCHFRGHWV